MSIELNRAETALISQLQNAGAKDAALNLAEFGLPTRRVESYHYTDLRNLLRDVPALRNATEQVGAPKLRVPGAFRVLLANGVVQQTSTPPAGIIVGEAEGSGLGDREDILVSLNRALVKKCLTVRLESSVEPVVHIDHRVTGDSPAHVLGAVTLDIAPGASAVVLETFGGSDQAHLGNHATRVLLGTGAKLTHIMVDLSSKKATHFHTLEYSIGADVYLRNLVLNSGSALSRTQMFGRFEGEGSHADLSGLNLVDDGQHCDITMDITHAVPNTTALETFKSVVRNKAKAIFQGRIVVDAIAQKTDAKMMAQGLMLTEGAQILTKPELEIFADDVQCGHGSTCGELDADTLFYLMSRGIPKAQASAMLIRAFVQELLDPITNEELNEELSAIVESWLSRGKGM